MTMFAKIGIITLAALFAPTEASAQAYEEYGAEEEMGEKPKAQKRAVREIVKGMYAKTNVGMGIYVGTYGKVLQPGTSVALAFGQDFYDQENMSMAWEVSFFQGINNGLDYEQQAAQGCVQTGTCIQGDLRTYTFVGLYEISIYPSRRFGVGFRAGGGMTFTPLLMHPTEYKSEVVEKAWDGNRPTVHDQPHPVVIGGPTIEYYTKLSHFSVGVDIDASYAVGFDLGISATGTLKYTF